MTAEHSERPPTDASHLGTAVAELDSALDFHATLGITEWATSGWKTAEYYDAGSRRCRRGQITGGIRPAELGRGAGVHRGRSSRARALGLAAWAPRLCTRTSDTGCATRASWPSDLIEAGCRLLLARASNDGVRRLRADDLADGRLPDVLDTCYFSTTTGVLVELVPGAIFATRLPATFGAEITRMLPAPATLITTG